jgi:ABC-type amino acid transport substrate-binding protein
LSKPILDALKELISDGIYLKILTKWAVQGGTSYGAITSPVINGASG